MNQNSTQQAGVERYYEVKMRGILQKKVTFLELKFYF